MEQRIIELKKRVAELTEWTKEDSRNQIPRVFGATSRKAINQDLLVATGVYQAANISFNTWLEVRIDGYLYWLACKPNDGTN